MKFYGSRREGKAVINNRDAMTEYINSIEGDFVIKITPTKDIRTLQMNNLYWGWLKLLSEESGYTKTELHNYFKTQLLCVEEEMKDQKVINCRSTSDLTIPEFSQYLQDVGRITSQHFGFYLPQTL